MTFRPELIDELLKDYRSPEDLMGESGIVKQLTKAPAILILELLYQR
jgi:putative transposase